MQTTQSFGCPFIAAQAARDQVKAGFVTTHDTLKAQASCGTLLLPLAQISEGALEIARWQTKSKEIAKQLRKGVDLSRLLSPVVATAAARKH